MVGPLATHCGGHKSAIHCVGGGGHLRFTVGATCHSLQAEGGSVNLLTHPVVITLLNMKWRTFGLYVFMINIVAYSSFLAALTSYALCLPKPTRNVCESVCKVGKHKIMREVLFSLMLVVTIS